MRKLISVLPSLILLLVFTTSAWAAKRGTVILDTSLFKDRSEGSLVIHAVPRGSPVLTADEPKGGFYKAKTKQGKIGYIPETAVSFGEAKSSSKRNASTPSSQKSRLRFFGGLDMFSASEFATLTGAPSISNGVYFGSDFSFFVSPKLFLVLRLEYLSKSFSLNFNGTYSFTMSSMPVMGGVGYVFSQGPQYSFDFIVLGGLGLSTNITGVKEGSTTDETTTYSGGATGFMAKVDGNYFFSKNFFGFLEAGYRFMKTSELTPSPVGTDQTLYDSATDSDATADASVINLSGPLFAIGIGYRF